MKAIVSTNYDPKYIFFMPIVAWTWQKIDVEVRFMMPFYDIHDKVVRLVMDTLRTNKSSCSVHCFRPPTENHEVTYTQVSRLFAAADTLIPDDEILITSDIDMAVFKIPPYNRSGNYFDIFGSDLVPPKQTPMCYVSATAGLWRKTFVKGRTLQECLDDELAEENCENMRGNLWCRDQELMHKGLMASSTVTHGRAKFPTQFASNRVDRDNSYWLEDLMANKENIVDAHLWRPGYTEENVQKIVALLHIIYPNEAFDWLWEYAAKFRSILNQ
jgi:hypothetical protein